MSLEKTIGFFAPFFVYGLIFILNLVLPGRWVTGYVTRPDSNKKLKYRLNGIIVLFTVVLLWGLAAHFHIIKWDYFYVYRWYALAGAITFGIVFTLIIVLPYPPVSRSVLTDLYLGRLENPQLRNGRIDAKMWLYLVGAVMLELNALNFCAHHYILYGGQASPGVYLCACLLTFFVVDYLTFEEVHLYTYDFFAERVGFKLGWGCIAFYPFFYAVALWSVAELPDPSTPVWLLVIYALIFFGGWLLSRGANLQKYFFKKNSANTFMGVAPEVVTDGNKSLLVSGFWGLSRHINYLGEILMATGIALSVGYPLLIWPWLYPLYYVALLLPRQLDDNKRCALKYGELWKTYEKRVPYKIIPFIY